MSLLRKPPEFAWVAAIVFLLGNISILPMSEAAAQLQSSTSIDALPCAASQPEEIKSNERIEVQYPAADHGTSRFLACDLQQPQRSTFCNRKLPIDERTENLVSLLVLKEKIGLLANNAAGVPRLGLKAYEWWGEALHGVAFSPGTDFDGPIKCVTSFPQVIGLGASFNRTLWNAVGQAVSTEARALHNTGRGGLTFWAPNINIFRDPRWGRGQETVGEDPLIAAEYAAYFVRGMQGEGFGESAMAEKCSREVEDSDGADFGVEIVREFGGHVGKAPEGVSDDGAQGGEAIGVIESNLGRGEKVQRKEDLGMGQPRKESFGPHLPQTRKVAGNKEVEQRGRKIQTFLGRSVGGAASLVRARKGRGTEGAHRHQRLKVSACCKHFTAYDLENWGGVDRYHFDAKVTRQDLEDTYQPPFRSCVERGHASGIMCAYNAVNGIPACADYGFLTGTARGAWAFDGYVTSDCGAVDNVFDAHHYTATPEDTCNATLAAGMDIACGTFLRDHASKAVAQGKLAESSIDRALKNLIKVQMRLGLFDGPEGDPWSHLGPADVATPEHAHLAADAARQGLVLLVNKNGTLPLERGVGTVAVIGPHIEAELAMQGNYFGPACHVTSPLSALTSAGLKTLPSAGCKDVPCSDTCHFPAALEAASKADVALLFVGLDQNQEKEGKDRVTLKLPGHQSELIKQVAGASKRPVIVLIVSGGPVDVGDLVGDGKVGAVLWAGYPGQAGGRAIADVLLGRYSPSGRLPVTWYPEAFVETVPMTDMRMRPDLENGYPGRSYRFYSPPTEELEPVFEFGHGLGYARFEYSNLTSVNGWTAEQLPANPESLSKLDQGKAWLRVRNPLVRKLITRIIGSIEAVGSLLDVRNKQISAPLPSSFWNLGASVHRKVSTSLSKSLGSFLASRGFGLNKPLSEGSRLGCEHGRFEVSVDVQNFGDRVGQETVLLFASPPEQAVREEGATLKSLIAFDKVELAPGEKQRIIFAVKVEKDLTVVDTAGNRRLWAGRYVLRVGSLQTTILISDVGL